jgi:hypothetical protein
MRGRRLIAIFAFALFLWFNVIGETMVKRGRDEGTMNIPASNVIGSGNITFIAAGFGTYGTTENSFDPTIGICAGIAGMIELRAHTSFTSSLEWGTSEVHLQVTTPKNDHLRFFGCAIQGDLYLSTTEDTISATAGSGKPVYNSYMWPSGIIDFDWLALYKTFPFKNYLTFGVVDDPTLLPRYDQISFRSGFEWKMHEHSGFLEIGAGLYKEKRYGNFGGDPSYEQRIVWLEPGIRYRFFGKYSVLGSLRIGAYQQLKQHSPLPTALMRGAVAMEIPLLFKETNTEAIRTLVFMDREKEKKRDKIVQDIAQGKRTESGMDKELKALDVKQDTPDSDQQKEALKKREEIQKKMEDIEKMLQENQ